jgi:hypothetical protein
MIFASSDILLEKPCWKLIVIHKRTTLTKIESIHEQFLSSWNSLVKVDPAGIFTIEQSGDHDRLHLEEGGINSSSAGYIVSLLTWSSA